MFDYPRVSNKFILGPLGTSPPPPPKKKTWELNMAIFNGFQKSCVKEIMAMGFPFWESIFSRILWPSRCPQSRSLKVPFFTGEHIPEVYLRVQFPVMISGWTNHSCRHSCRDSILTDSWGIITTQYTPLIPGSSKTKQPSSYMLSHHTQKKNAPPWSMLLPNACRHPNRNGCEFLKAFPSKAM